MRDPDICRTYDTISRSLLAQAHRAALELRPGPQSALGADEGGRTKPGSRPPAGAFHHDPGEAQYQAWAKLAREWINVTLLLIYAAKKLTTPPNFAEKVTCTTAGCDGDALTTWDRLGLEAPVCQWCDAHTKREGHRPDHNDIRRRDDAARKRKTRT